MSDEPEKLEGEVLVTVEHKIPLERVRDLLTCATEGGQHGIGYWAQITGYRGDRTGVVYPHFEMPFKPGGAVLIQDKEDETAPIYILDMAAMRKGLHIMAKDQPVHMHNFLRDNEDAETGDVFVQLSLFGELVYG